MIKPVCLINSYNYARYLDECIQSTLAQTVPFGKIIIVDDGSKDESPQIIQKYSDAHQHIVTIFKENGGQASSFNAAVSAVNEDEYIFLLDSDDFYPPNYLELMLPKISDSGVSFSYCSQVNIIDDQLLKTAYVDGGYEDLHIPSHSAIVRMRKNWIGRPTSCISLSGSLMKKLLPYPSPGDFVTRADDILVWGASIAGASKLYVPSVNIGWRQHDNNNSKSIGSAGDSYQQREISIQQLFNYYCQKFGLDAIPSGKEFLDEYNSLSKLQREFIGLTRLF